MKTNILFLILSLSFVTSIQAYDIDNKYDKYIEKLQKERDRLTDDRDMRAEGRRWNIDLDKLTQRREIVDEARRYESSIRKEIRRIF